jgi:hypothetical protein
MPAVALKTKKLKRGTDKERKSESGNGVRAALAIDIGHSSSNRGNQREPPGGLPSTVF